MKKYILLCFFQILACSLLAQSSFKLEGNRDFHKQRFDLVNHLVIVPVEVNGVELSFLLDTGVNSTLIFSLSAVDSMQVKNATYIHLRGLGAGKPIRAIKSRGNEVRMGDVVSYNETVFILTEEVISLSNRLGVTVNGILGYEFFKNFIVETNYVRKFMKIYRPESYRYKSCRRCQNLPLNFYRNKPYIQAVVKFVNGREAQVDLLVDSGSGDALWLFEDDKIRLPEKYFEDFLGFGISGSVYGKRSRVPFLALGKHKFSDITTSFPDSLYTRDVTAFEDRNGSIGGELLKRFHVVTDYPNKQLRLKPNKFFRKSFEYNMSGVVIEHYGYQLVKESTYNRNPSFSVGEEDPHGVEVYRSSYKVKFTLEPQYRIAEIRPGSPAEKAGLKRGDIILKLNGKPVYKYTLAKITGFFSSREGKRMRLDVERDGVKMSFSFRLERLL